MAKRDVRDSEFGRNPRSIQAMLLPKEPTRKKREKRIVLIESELLDMFADAIAQRVVAGMFSFVGSDSYGSSVRPVSGVTDEDKILNYLTFHPDGCSRSDLSKLVFKRNKSKLQLDQLLGSLSAKQKIQVTNRKIGSHGTQWIALFGAICDRDIHEDELTNSTNAIQTSSVDSPKPSTAEDRASDSDRAAGQRVMNYLRTVCDCPLQELRSEIFPMDRSDTAIRRVVAQLQAKKRVRLTVDGPPRMSTEIVRINEPII